MFRYAAVIGHRRTYIANRYGTGTERAGAFGSNVGRQLIGDRHTSSIGPQYRRSRRLLQRATISSSPGLHGGTNSQGVFSLCGSPDCFSLIGGFVQTAVCGGKCNAAYMQITVAVIADFKSASVMTPDISPSSKLSVLTVTNHGLGFVGCVHMSN